MQYFLQWSAFLTFSHEQFISQLPEDSKEAERAKEEEVEEEEKPEEKASEEEQTAEENNKEDEDASALFGGSSAGNTPRLPKGFHQLKGGTTLGPAKEGEDVSNLFGGPTSGGGPADSSFNMFSGAPPPSDGSDPFTAIGNQVASDDPFAQIAANLKTQSGTSPFNCSGGETILPRCLTCPAAGRDAPAAAKSSLPGVPPTKATIKFNLAEDTPENIIARSLIVGNFEAAVNCCVKIGRMVTRR